MKNYTNVKLYSLLTPKIWSLNDNPLSCEFNTSEPYDFIHKFENKKKVLYHIDQYGFRNYNSMDSKLWFFGCSFTFCEALEYEKSFPYLISQQLNMPFYNFGTLAASIDLVTRLLYKLKTKLSQKTIFVFLPYSKRYETLINNKLYNMFPSHSEYMENLPYKNIEDSLQYRLIKNVMLIKSLSENIDIHFFTFENNDILNNNLKINLINPDLHVDAAYDGTHLGEVTNKNIANLMLNSIK